jgi:uncharacterized membrane protein YvlD (DUF360 family)
MERDGAEVAYGQRPRWEPEVPRLRVTQLLLAWGVGALSVLAAAGVVPGVELHWPGGGLLAAALIGVLNAILPPVLAALRLPYTLVLGFLLLLVADAFVLLAAQEIVPDRIVVDSFGDALLATLVMAAATIVLQVVLGTNDDSEYQLRVTRRIARRQGAPTDSDEPGIIFLEIDGLAMPILRRAMQSGSAPAMARWMEEDGYHLDEWETDLSSQTGASQAGILLGSNEGIPAFRWVEKERGVLMSCSSPADCAEIEHRLSTGAGLLSGGGASRGNLLSGDAEAVILTVSRTDEEKRANPGYRAFLANGFNVTRALVLFGWEIGLEWLAARRAIRRDVRPRGHRGGIYPLLRGFMCVVVRDLVVYGVLTDMMRGRPAIYATFASYDEVAHHSGLERADTLEALRKLDQQFDRIYRARRFAPRPYEIVVLSDHGQTQGATFKQRNGYGLDDLVAKSIASSGRMLALGEGDEQEAMASRAVTEATGRGKEKRAANDVRDRDVVVLGSGNLGLVYLMESQSRLTLEELEQRHPALVPALRDHPHVGWVLVRSAAQGPLVLGPRGTRRLADGEVTGEDPLAHFSPTAAQHLLRTDGFRHCADLMVGSFYDPERDEGCAFEELISFHGGLGGPQTRPFVLHPPALRMPAERVLGAGALHEVLMGWRAQLATVEHVPAAPPAPPAVPAA